VGDKQVKKDIYFYWGNDTMSYMRYMTLYSFCALNSDWSVYLIQNKQEHRRTLSVAVEKQDKTEYKGKDYSYLIKDLNIKVLDFENSMINLEESVVRNMSDVHTKDILNWKLLAEQGGVVADMDILFTAPMGEAIHTDTEIGLICFDGHPQKDYIPVSFMYSSGDNEFFKKTYENALKNYDPTVYESCGTMCIEEKNLDAIKTNYPNSIVQELDDGIVFPFIAYPWTIGIDMLYNGDNTSVMDGNTVGIHWYAGAPASQKANNLLNNETVYTINNTISMNIRRIL
jgi:hypothetical protein